MDRSFRLPDPDTRLPHGERRRAVRQRLHTPVYVSFNTPRSGAVLDLSELLDLHEDGFAVQTAIPTAMHDHAVHDDDRLAPNRAVTLCLDLPETKKYIHGSGQVMWTDDTGRAGIRFSFLPDTSRHALKEWLFANLLVASTNHAARAGQLAQQRQDARSFELVSRSSQPEPLPGHLRDEPSVMGMPDPYASDPEPVSEPFSERPPDAVAAPVRDSLASPPRDSLASPPRDAGLPFVRESGASPVSDQARMLSALEDVRRQVQQILNRQDEGATSGVNALAADARGVAARARDTRADDAEAEAVNHESALHFITERAAILTGASGAALALLVGDHVICRASLGEPAPPVGSEVDVDSGLSGECLRRGILVSCGDTEADPRVDPEVCRMLGLGSFAAVPIFSDFQVVGLLEVFSPYPHTFAKVEETILKRLAEMVPQFDERDPAQERLDQERLAQERFDQDEILLETIAREAVMRESVEQQPLAEPSTAQQPVSQRPLTQPSIPEPAIISRETQRLIPQRPAATPDAIHALVAERLSEQAREQAVTSAAQAPAPSLEHASARAAESTPNNPAESTHDNPAEQAAEQATDPAPELITTELNLAVPTNPLARRFPFSHVMLLVMAIAVAAMALGYLLAPAIEQRWLRPAQSAEASSPPPAAIDRRGHALSTDELRKLADQGDPDAEWQMGILYHDGEAVPKDDALAVRWFELAAAQGYVRAQSTLGAYYWAGRGVPQDLSKAYFWSQLALAQGDEDSKSRLEGLSAQMTQAQVAAARQQAETWLRLHNQRANSKAN
jgi:hypothetical protein